MGLEALPRTIELSPSGACVHIVDQSALPYDLTTKTLASWEDMVHAIQRLEIRGAPALGVAGACALCLFAHNQDHSTTSEELLTALDTIGVSIASTRPTAVNLSWGVNRAQQAARSCYEQGGSPADIKSAILAEAQAILAEDEALCRAIGAQGAALISPHAHILTHCNAGSLATAYYGTALGVIYAAYEQGKIERVYADETRPVGQGWRLTAWELAQVGVPVTLLCDNMAASLMLQNTIDAVIVGADRICRNGDTANKIGTYGLAVLARHHNAPFYVAAPYSTFDWTLSDGSSIEIEQRPVQEVLEHSIPGVDVHNPAFDVTPGSLISAFITEKGIFSPNELPCLYDLRTSRSPRTHSERNLNE